MNIEKARDMEWAEIMLRTYKRTNNEYYKEQLEFYLDCISNNSYQKHMRTACYDYAYKHLGSFIDGFEIYEYVKSLDK